MRKKFGRTMRLNTYDVSNVLKQGRRVRSQPGTGSETASIKPCVEARVITRVQEGVSPSGARLAVAVPKRLLKKAVERNLVKRWIREALRQHPARKISMDVLLTLTAKVNFKIVGEKARIRQQINDLLLTVDGLSIKRKLQTRN